MWREEETTRGTPLQACGSFGRLGCFVLRRTFRDDAVRIGLEAVGTETAVQDDLGLALERIGHNTGVGGVDDVARLGGAGRIVLHFEFVIERIARPENRPRNNITVKLE